LSDAFAHLGGASGRPHLLLDHLRDVAEKAREFAEAATSKDSRLADLARCTGWLHDLGKFRPAFQEYLGGRRPRDKMTRHSVFGAAAAFAGGLPGASFAIIGHHAGLPDLGCWQSALKDADLSPRAEAPQMLRLLEASRRGGPFPWQAAADRPIPRDRKGHPSVPLDDELATRILFSCLVDADYLDTERYFAGRERRAIGFDASALSDRLSARIGGLGGGRERTPVDAVRDEVHAACLRASALEPGLFSLTAPTGSGKTLASMAFALEHARRWRHRRVIVVLPFLAIIEQNARAYREALDPRDEGIVLEHHSAVSVAGDGDETEDATGARSRAGRATENWDAPVIVTTAVQFLESLFSRRPGRCRKLHNIARSVVIFDEVQTLPFPLLDPILGVLRDLSRGFGVTSLLCSATRPTFARSANLPSGFEPGECREIIADPPATFRALRRCRLELPFLRETWSWDDLADRLEREPTALVIVNLRKHAQALYDVLKRRGSANLFHLSSTMCPAHREAVLGRKENPEEGTIYRALETGKCLVISTQVIEAGVDISFPAVYRTVSPLDAIIQAAGRCDREGLLTMAAGLPAGRVVVFRPEGQWSGPPGYYARATEETTVILAEYADDPSRALEEPEIFEKYHDFLIAGGEGSETAREIQQHRHWLNFKEVDQRFKVIDEAGRGVAVPYAGGTQLIEEIRLKGHLTLDDRRKLQRFTVGLMPNWVEHFRRVDQVQPILKGQEEGPLRYVGDDYDAEAIGLRLSELPPESFLFGL